MLNIVSLISYETKKKEALNDLKDLNVLFPRWTACFWRSRVWKCDVWGENIVMLCVM